jgi:hypothetical protein
MKKRVALPLLIVIVPGQADEVENKRRGGESVIVDSF